MKHFQEQMPIVAPIGMLVDPMAHSIQPQRQRQEKNMADSSCNLRNINTVRIRPLYYIVVRSFALRCGTVQCSAI